MPAPIGALFCLVLAMSLHADLAQDDGYELFPAYPESRYKLPSLELSWADASAACQSDGGGSHLVVVNSDTEAAVVKELVARLIGPSYPNPYVGIVAADGVWRTVLGGLVSESGYDRWGPGYPMAGATQNCGYVIPDGLYRNWGCSSVQRFICEKPNV